MKATGIVRRIDDLGRVVIPKEIRRTMRIREGDPLEIYTASDGEVIFKKYSPIGELSEFASQYTDVLNRATTLPVIITDRDHVIAASGAGKKEFEGKPISRELDELMENRQTMVASRDENNFIKITLDDSGVYVTQAISTIICEGDAIGSVILYDKNEKVRMGETENQLVLIAAGFLGKQMEQ